MFFLADDSLIFSKANPKEAKELMGILRKYEKGSGLEVNLEKSLVFFSKNVPQSQQVHVCLSHSKYMYAENLKTSG